MVQIDGNDFFIAETCTCGREYNLTGTIVPVKGEVLDVQICECGRIHVAYVDDVILLPLDGVSGVMLAVSEGTPKNGKPRKPKKGEIGKDTWGLN